MKKVSNWRDWTCMKAPEVAEATEDYQGVMNSVATSGRLRLEVMGLDRLARCRSRLVRARAGLALGVDPGD